MAWAACWTRPRSRPSRQLGEQGLGEGVVHAHGPPDLPPVWSRSPPSLSPCPPPATGPSLSGQALSV